MKLWYIAQDKDSDRWIGNHKTREEAIEHGRIEYDGEPFYVVEANNPPLRLSDWVDVDDVLDRAEDAVADSDRVCYEFDEPPYFEMLAEQKKDLEKRLTKAIDEWQDAHGLKFRVYTFDFMSNPERIPGSQLYRTAEVAVEKWCKVLGPLPKWAMLTRVLNRLREAQDEALVLTAGDRLIDDMRIYSGSKQPIEDVFPPGFKTVIEPGRVIFFDGNVTTVDEIGEDA